MMVRGLYSAPRRQEVSFYPLLPGVYVIRYYVLFFPEGNKPSQAYVRIPVNFDRRRTYRFLRKHLGSTDYRQDLKEVNLMTLISKWSNKCCCCPMMTKLLRRGMWGEPWVVTIFFSQAAPYQSPFSLSRPLPPFPLYFIFSLSLSLRDSYVLGQ